MTEEQSLPGERRFTRRSATFIGSFTLAARIVERLGAFGQITVIASVYGSGYLADRYFIASIAPLIVGAIMGEALSANILPALVRGTGDERRLVAAGFWLAAGLLVLVTAAYLAVATVVVRRTAPAGSTGLGVWYAFAPLGALLALSGYLSGVLTYLERYVWPPFRSAVSTVGGFFLTLVVISFTRDLAWVALAITAGYGLSLVALLLELRRAMGRGVLGRPQFAALAATVRLGGGLGSPVLGGLLGGQIFVLFERALASTIGVGAVSTLSYARGIVFTPTIVSQSVALGIYPGMVRAFEARDLEHVRGGLLRGLRLTLFLAFAFAGFFAFFGRETTALLLERGAFDPADAHETGVALATFALALVGTMIMVFAARVFYAVDYFRGVVWTQISALVVYVAVALPFRAAWGTSGLAAAFGVAEVCGAAFALVLAARQVRLAVPETVRVAVLPAAGRAAVVAAAFGSVRLAVAAGALGDWAFVRIGVALTVGATAAAAVLWSSAWPELGRLKRTIRRLAL